MIIKDMPKFENQDKLFDWLAEKEGDLIYEAKSTVKEADALELPMTHMAEGKPGVSKATSEGFVVEPNEPGALKVRVIINTTNLMDSHKDVHLPGIWEKSLKENKRIKHKQEHGHRFKDIISDGEDLKAFTKSYEWRELGYDIEGKTQALVFDSTVKQSRNSEMYGEYKAGNVDNHSVGMMYTKMLLAMNSDKEEHAQYKINWDKYYPEIANKVAADKSGYFWPVLEAKAREGSAVPDGSNHITPTLSRKAHSEEASTLAAEALKKQEADKNFINSLKI